MTAGDSWCAQVFFKELSQLISTFGLLWTLFLSVKMTCSLSLSLSLCLSVCLSVSLSLSLTHSNSVTVSLSLSLSLSLPHLPWFSLQELTSVCMFAKTLVRTAIFQNSKAAPSSSRSRVEVVVVVGLPYVMSFMSTRRSAKPVKKRLGPIQEELQKSFPTADTLPEKTPDHLEPENAAPKGHSEENVHDELQRSVKTPSNLQRKVAFCPPGRRRAPLLRCNMSDLKSVYYKETSLNCFPFPGPRLRIPLSVSLLPGLTFLAKHSLSRRLLLISADLFSNLDTFLHQMSNSIHGIRNVCPSVAVRSTIWGRFFLCLCLKNSPRYWAPSSNLIQSKTIIII